MSPARSQEQLILLLKLIEVNNANSKNRNLEIRQKIWRGITQQLNRLSGAVKTVDGWKRCYTAWRVNAGKNHKLKMEKLLQDVPNDNRYLISVSDDEVESSPEKDLNYLNPTDKQRQRLHDLILKHKVLLLSNADDESLKKRLWENITKELNNIAGGLVLTSVQWQNLTDLEKYRTKKGRKPALKRSISIDDTLQNTKVAKLDLNTPNSMNVISVDDSIQASTSLERLDNENIIRENETLDDIDKILDEIEDEDMTELDTCDDDDYDDADFNNEHKTKQIKPSPLVNSFKFSARMINTVDQLKEDVCTIKETLKETTNNLISLREILEHQCKQQDELNAILKRNTQLLKVLVEFKVGKRTSFNKRNPDFDAAI